ncbi:MAG: flavodoxin family protein [Methanomassiliicoccaceae archaeon]|nr:flavodoxin family protein [Methanomassiliicoccaceae archaeon]
MSKIVAIIASPRKNGNCKAIVDAITDGAMGLSPNVVDIVDLNALRFTNGCQACMGCKSSGSCVTKDDLLPVLDLIREAEALIVAVPVYFGHSSSQYRMLEDRLYSFIGKDRKGTLAKNKKLVTVVTCGGESGIAKAVADDIERIYVNYFSFEPVGRIVFSEMESGHVAEKDDELLERARLIGKKL